MNYQRVKVYFTASVMIVCISLLLSLSLYAQDNADPLTQEELDWLSAYDGKIILAHDPDAKPVDYLDEHGEFKGLAADYVSLLE